MNGIRSDEDRVGPREADNVPLVLAIKSQDALIFESGMFTTCESRLQIAVVIVWPDLPDSYEKRRHRETLESECYIRTPRCSARIKIAAQGDTPRYGLYVVHLRNSAQEKAYQAEQISGRLAAPASHAHRLVSHAHRLVSGTRSSDTWENPLAAPRN